MKAIRIEKIGGPEVLQVQSVPQPEPQRGEVRIKLEAIGLNFIEIYFRSGLSQATLPLIPGSEGAGIIDAVGAEVTDFKVGDRVVSSSLAGSYADYALAPAAKVVPVPDGINLQTASALILQGLTAHYLTHSTFPLKEGDTALVHAAAGGTGALLVQMAKRRGARVFGTVSTEEKAQIAHDAGADEIIYYTQTDFETEVKRLTTGRGVDVVYDSVGKTTFDKSLNCLRPRGYMVLYGQSSGAVPPLNPQVLNAKGSLFLTRPTLVHHTATREELQQRASDIFTWVKSGELTVRIDRTFPLSEVADAHRYMEGRQTKGKVLLIP